MDQTSFDGCFGCGPDNKYGLKATFRNLENGDVEGVFIAEDNHCGYRDAVHVGPIAGFISEALGRLSFQKDLYYLTQSLTVNFNCAVSPGVKLRAFATLKKQTGKYFTGEAKVYGPEGELIATGEGRFLYMDTARVKKVVSS